MFDCAICKKERLVAVDRCSWPVGMPFITCRHIEKYDPVIFVPWFEWTTTTKKLCMWCTRPETPVQKRIVVRVLLAFRVRILI